MKLMRLLAALSLCVTAWGQGSRFDSNVFTAASNIPVGAKSTMYTVPFAQIKVCSYPATGAPCTNTVNIYRDPALTQIITQPLTADAQGRFGFWAAPGTYAYSVTGNGNYLGTYNFSLAGAGGGSATFPSNPGLVYSTSASSGRNATYSDIFSLFTGTCTGTAVPLANGTCGTLGTGSVTNFSAAASGWPSWLSPSVANNTTTPALSVLASAIPNSALANSSVTVNGTACALGGTCTVSTTGVTSINGTSGPFTFTGSGVSCTSGTCTFSGGGSMTYPAAGIANSTGTAWGTSYSATNLIPATFLPTFGTSAAGIVPSSGGGTTNYLRADGTWAAPPGGSGISGLTTGYLPQATSATAIGNSYIDYNVTNAGAYTSTKDIYAPAFHSTDTAGSGFGFVGAEGMAPAGVAGSDGLWADSTAHRLLMNNNNTGALTLVGIGTAGTTGHIAVFATGGNDLADGGPKIADVTVTLPTTAIAANTCTVAATVAMSGVATTSAFSTAFASDPSAVVGWGSSGGLSFRAWPTANTLNWEVCNTTASSITPGAMSLNVGAQ